MYYIMRKSYYVMHKILRYAKNVLRYAVIIILCGNYYVMRRHRRCFGCIRLQLSDLPAQKQEAGSVDFWIK